MNRFCLRHLCLLLIALVLASCAQPKVYEIDDVVRAGSDVEYYAQVADGTWKLTQKMPNLPRDMHVREAEKWAISAARTRLGDGFQNTCFRVTPPNNKPVVVWQRRHHLPF